MSQILIDNAGSILLAVCFIITSILGKPEDSEKAKAKLIKKQVKLAKKGFKIANKIESIDNKLQGGEE